MAAAKKSKDPVPYSEDNPDHVPNPMWQSGVVDTTGTTGDLGSRIETISPMFAQAKADAFGNAVAAIDDPDRDASDTVVFSGEQDLTREEQEQGLRDAADKAKKAADASVSPAQSEAARTGDEGAGSTVNPNDSTEGRLKPRSNPDDTASSASSARKTPAK